MMEITRFPSPQLFSDRLPSRKLYNIICKHDKTLKNQNSFSTFSSQTTRPSKRQKYLYLQISSAKFIDQKVENDQTSQVSALWHATSN